MSYENGHHQTFVVKVTVWMGINEQQNLAITVTSWWGRMRLKSSASRLFTQPFIRALTKENIKAPRRWPFAGISPETGEFPAQMASNAQNVSIWWRHHGESLCNFLNSLNLIWCEDISYKVVTQSEGPRCTWSLMEVLVTIIFIFICLKFIDIPYNYIETIPLPA